MERLDQYWSRTYAGVKPIEQSPRDALRRFWYETASGHPAAIRMTAEVLGREAAATSAATAAADVVHRGLAGYAVVTSTGGSVTGRAGPYRPRPT